MADLSDRTDNITLYDESGNPVTIVNDGGVYRLAVSADVSGSGQGPSWEHKKIHDSLAFFTNRYITGLSNGGTSDILVVTDSSHKVHLHIDSKTLSGGSLEIREGVTASSNGTALTVYNRDRASASVGTALWYHTPTITATGTLLMQLLMPGTGGLLDPSVFEDEIILKVSTKYLFRFNSTAGSNALAFTPNWYEV